MDKDKENENQKKTETINDTVNTRETKIMNKDKKSKTRMLLVLLFILIFAIVSYIQLRGSYLEYLELGEKYTSIFFTNLKFKYSIMAVNFVILYFIIKGPIFDYFGVSEKIVRNNFTEEEWDAFYK